MRRWTYGISSQSLRGCAMGEPLTHRLVSTPDETRGACGKDQPGDTLAANPFPLTCPDCAKLETDDTAPTPRQLRDAANTPWESK